MPAPIHPVTRGDHDTDLYLDPETVAAFAARYGCSPITVSRRLKILRRELGGPARKPMIRSAPCAAPVGMGGAA